MKRLLLIFSIAAGLTIAGCGSDDSGHSHGEGTHTHSGETNQHGSEEHHAHPHDSADAANSRHTHAEAEEGHAHSGEEAHSHENEETGSAVMLGLDETYDEVRKGVRLTLSYSRDTESFSGTIENTTREALPQISVGVELSNGTELGLTSPVTLDAGESRSIELDASGETFESWSAHSEMGSGGHSHGEGSGHEHHND